jgi:hypothetical protein
VAGALKDCGDKNEGCSCVILVVQGRLACTASILITPLWTTGLKNHSRIALSKFLPNLLQRCGGEPDCQRTRLNARRCHLKDSTYEKQEAVTANKVSFSLKRCNCYVLSKTQT